MSLFCGEMTVNFVPMGVGELLLPPPSLSRLLLLLQLAVAAALAPLAPRRRRPWGKGEEVEEG